MQDILTSIILGIVEGLTEFLPVSSTGHLLVAERLLALPPEKWEVFTVVIQLGAILAVVAVFWKRLWDAVIGLPSSPQARRFALSVLIAFFPSVIAGVLLKKWIDKVLLDPGYALPVIAASWIAGGILILLLERLAPRPRYHDAEKLPMMTALQIGLFQILSIIFPGTSRSGATILGAELIGVERAAAALFTFYLAVPTMFGATVYDLWKNRHALSGDQASNIGIGFVVAFIVALFVVRGFIVFIARYGLVPFGWYRIAAGAALTGYLLMR
ncbi:MAG TPA: undecaprenyl-diphosphate phosphatase [Rhizomicrobium sp.]|jgi:undecaprenyl-diphosphatase